MAGKRFYVCGWLLMVLIAVCSGQEDASAAPEPAAAEPSPAALTTERAVEADSPAAPIVEPAATVASTSEVVTGSPTEPPPVAPVEAATSVVTTAVVPDASKPASTQAPDPCRGDMCDDVNTPGLTPSTESVEPTTVADPPVVPPLRGVEITSPLTGDYSVGDYVNMRCVNPTGGDIEWVADMGFGEMIIEDNPPFILNMAEQGGEMIGYLSIEGATADDAATYTCRAVDDPSDKDEITLTLLSDSVEGTTSAAPVDVSSTAAASPGEVRITDPSSGNVTQGETLMITCANPTGDDLEWVTTGPAGETVLEDNPPFIINDALQGTDMISYLSIELIEKENEGDYICRSIANPANADSITVLVLPVVSDPGAPCRGDLCDDKTTTTLAPDTTRATVITEPGIEDPCTDYKAIQGNHFTVGKPDGDVDCFAAFESPSSWIQFYTDDESQPAEIVTVPIKQDYCGVHFAFHVHLQENDMPDANTTDSRQICSYMKGEVNQPCANHRNILVHNCNNQFFVYKFLDDLRAGDLCNTKTGANVCLKAPNETIPYKYLSDAAPTTTAEPETVMPEYEFPTIDDPTEEQINGTITVEYYLPKGLDQDNLTGFWYDIDPKFRQLIANSLNDYMAKPELPEVVPTTEEATTTVAPTTIAETEPPIFVATTLLATDGTTTPLTTTTTPAPTEPAEYKEYVIMDEVLESDIEKIEETEAVVPDGPIAPDNVDTDAGKGPGRRRVAREKMEIVVTDQAEDEEAEAMDPYTMDDVYYVFDTPSFVKGIVQLAIVVVKGEDSTSNRTRRAAAGGQVVPQDVLDNSVSDIDAKEHEDNTGLEYKQHYQGAPRDPEVDDGETGAAVSVWDAHMGLFIAVIVLLIICIIVIIIGILCIKCKGRKSKPEKTPLRAEEGHQYTTVIENPISDDEMIKGESAPMTETTNPAYTPNGSGQHLTKGDEDNGWVVPMDELSFEERGRPEVENTKL